MCRRSLSLSISWGLLELEERQGVSIMASVAFLSSSLFVSRSSPFANNKRTENRTFLQGGVRCKLVEPLQFSNGSPCIPAFNDLCGPDFLPLNYSRDFLSNNDRRLRIFSGTANPTLSQEIACYMGLELGKIKIKRFADGEIYVQLQESVRGCDVFLVQPTCPPANENLMELLIMIDACRRASAKNITAVIPYFGYARADRKTQGRESIAAKLVANLITEAGANRVLACDLHSGQSMGYFDIPVDHVYGQPVILDYLASKTISSNDLVVVSPDVGGVARARAFAKKLSDAPLAIVDKRRQGHNVAEVMNLIGDVRGKVAVMVDDMIDTAGTITNGAALLHQEGAREVYACCTHAVFSPPAIERLAGGLFQEVIITNTIPVMEKNYFPQLTILSVANLLGETIWRVHDDCSTICLCTKGLQSPLAGRQGCAISSYKVKKDFLEP
ncbi:ribose-phosphate pyrophosphokinase 1 isoform X3 [Amborella trichopoda]|uniref:ribose-phosphate pyrophosphokinase 1 isoform X3 n=1 Tax=Amborella trichopoda TaxID=13333 RepID=UPI0009C14C44|nr:ribose-phosphate pyrophosphokinase 1 isoform X3 [Amborella trichopoda]|eukprot:XP_020524808.1 ribose-phosphate pyrophosphokinase 1 isoform X3 [Amborella trichopoda]